MNLDPLSYGLDYIAGKTIVAGHQENDGLHIELDDGNTLVIVGTFYAGVLLKQNRTLQ